MKFKLLLIALFITVSMFSQKQEKESILQQINSYRLNSIMNVSYDVPKEKLWEAVYIMMKKEYIEIKKQDKEKGIIEGYYETDVTKETLTAEIIGSGPYYVTFSVNSKTKRINPDRTVTSIEIIEMPIEYKWKVEEQIYKTLYGPLKLSDEIIDRVNKYNDKQKRDKNKIDISSF